ncbi:multiple sugar transport system permease protein [Kaistia soli DSM 19436]|uniref:Multiple sugar transport system permease protein n=1 Tax=Kaistia soli DSM 19436 TaxID=1122133 RepID=A0A1M4YNE7_9HYPH|nr:sugar ABC transporter permease [Kaistia soli]SHF07335.1 multiple sugar transport system permease protein [Kaistia soli DSM 19436]
MRPQSVGWLFMAPTLVILFVFGVLPFVYVLVISFFDWNSFAADPTMRFSGVQNYRDLVFDTGYLMSLWNTLKFGVFAVASEIVLGYFLAQLFMRNFPLKSFFRTIHTLPLMIAPVAVGATWRLMTVPGLGPIPYYLDKWFGYDYLISRYAGQAFFTTVVMDVWHWTPLVTLTLLAALSSMPKEPFEQAQIDGANKLQTFWYVTLPLLKPAILAAVFIRLMDAMRTVDEVWMLTGGGPAAATRYVGLYIWRVVFPKTDYGYGSAMSLITLYLTIVMCWLLYAGLVARRDLRKPE